MSICFLQQRVTFPPKPSRASLATFLGFHVLFSIKIIGVDMSISSLVLTRDFILPFIKRTKEMNMGLLISFAAWVSELILLFQMAVVPAHLWILTLSPHQYCEERSWRESHKCWQISKWQRHIWSKCTYLAHCHKKWYEKEAVASLKERNTAS